MAPIHYAVSVFDFFILTFLTGLLYVYRRRWQKVNCRTKEMEEMLPAEEPNMIEQEIVISHPPKLRQPHLDPYPWLMIHDGKRKEHLAFYSILENQHHVYVIPELQNKRICCLNKEWLVLMDDSTHMLSVLNILTKEKVYLPLLDLIEWGYRKCVLLLNSDGSSWRVLFIAGPKFKLLSYQLGDSEFVEQKLNIEYESYARVQCITSFGGDVYVMICGGYNLYAAKLSDRYLDFTQVVEGDPVSDMVTQGCSAQISYLVESCGQVLFVAMCVVNNGVRDIDIFRADLDGEEWVKLDGIGDGAIFLDEASSSGYSYPDARALGLQANCIYYVVKGRRNLFVYDIQDQSISMSLPCDSTADFRSSLAWMFIHS